MRLCVFPPEVRRWLRVALSLSGGLGLQVDKVGPGQRELPGREMQVLAVKGRWGHPMIKAKGSWG